MLKENKIQSNRDATMQQTLLNIQNEQFDLAKVDPRSKDETQMFIDQMKAHLDSIIEIKRAEKEKELNQLKQTFDNGMMKMSTATRKMTIAEFNAANRCDLVSIIRNTKESFRDLSSSASTSSQGPVMSTPAMTRRNKLAEPTPPRTVRRGEKVMVTSQNGSPVDLYEEGALIATVSKGRREPSMEIHVGQGKFLNIDAECIKGASRGEKAVARDQLEILRNQIDQLISQEDIW